MKKLVGICSIVALALCFAFWCGCAGPQKTTDETKAPPSGEPTDERRFEPLDLPQDLEVVPLKHPRGGDIHGKVDAVESQPVSQKAANGRVVDLPGAIDTLNSQAFKVQIFTSKLYGEARRAVTVAEEIFDRAVFLDYEVPYFKVRVGSFAQREDAENYLQRVKAAGYPNAWVVMVNVGVKEPAPLYPEGTRSVSQNSINR